MASLSKSITLADGSIRELEWSEDLKLITKALSSGKDTNWIYGPEHDVIIYDKTTDTAYRAPKKALEIDNYQRTQLVESEQQFYMELAFFFFRMHSKGWPEGVRKIIEIEIAKYDHRFNPDNCYIEETFVSKPLRENRGPSFVALQVLRAVNMGSLPYKMGYRLEEKELKWLADSENLVFTDDFLKTPVLVSNELGSHDFEVKALPVSTAQRQQIAKDGDKLFGRAFRDPPLCFRELDGSITLSHFSSYLGIETKMTEEMLRACTDRIEYTRLNVGKSLEYVGPKLGSLGRAWTRPADWHGEHGVRIYYEPDGSAQVRSTDHNQIIVSATEKGENTLEMSPREN